MDDDFSRGDSPPIDDLRRQCRHRIKRKQRPGLGIEGKGRHREIEFVDAVGEVLLRVKGEVAGAGARSEGSRAVRLQGGPVDVEGVDEHPIAAEIAGHGKPAVGRNVDRVRMRSCLPLGIDAGALRLIEHVLDHAAGPRAARLRGGLQAAVGRYSQAEHTATAIVCHQQNTPRGID